MKYKWLVLLLLCTVVVCGLCGCGNTEKYDVIVVGGDPEGISAAVTAARNGMKTLLIEDADALGGLMTLGGLNFIDMCTGDDGTLLTRGTFKEFYDAVGGTAFDITAAKNVFLQMVEAEENLTLKLNTKFIEPVMTDNTIIGVIIEENGEQITCKANSVIDATVDADVAAAAGASYTYLGEDYGHTENVTGVTLVFEVSGLNWSEIQAYLNGDDNPNTGCTEKAAWGYNEESFAYVPQDAQTRLRGLNIALQDNGNALINGFIIFGVEPLKDVSQFAGIQRGKAELEYIIPYLRENYRGFEAVALVDTASQLYVRESRHILGEYQLTLDDVMENRWFSDTVAIGSYPVDVPPNAKRKVGYIVGAPDRYGVPFRCLVPQQIDGMLVVGRSASYTSLAAGSARVIPLGMAEGDAAGVAAAYAKEHKMTFREISKDTAAISSIQQSLREQGAYLTPWEPIVMEVEQHWAYEGVKILRSLGLLYGGYANDYRLDDAVSSNDLDEIVPGLMLALGVEAEDGIDYEAQTDGTVAAADVLQTAVMLAGLDADNARMALIDTGILTEQLQPYFADDMKVPNRAEMIMLLANVYTHGQVNAPQTGEHYDVIVVGGDPEGVCAAVSSARNGLKTLLIEDDEALGGLMTLGKLNFIDICESRDGSILTQGLFMEFYDAVGGTAFDVETAKQFFYDWVVNEENAALKLNTSFVAPVMDGNAITGVVVAENGKKVTYTADRVIDATVDADVAAAAGVPYTVAGEDIGEKERQMGVTLVFELSGVNWDAVADYLENDDNAGTGATEKTAWGYTREGYAYEPQDELMRLRGFNVARQDNGNVLINALIIFGVDAMSEESKAEGIARAQKELEYIVPYVREHFVGFENCELVGTASQLYIRESRHIIGEYQLTIDDVLENRDQWDKIAIVAYPADIQPTAGQTYGTVIGSPDRYAIPFRSIVPLEVDNMLVIGRSASYTSLAAGSARVIPVGMAEGEAAGVASAYSLANQISFRDMTADETAIQSVQKALKQQGAYLDDFEVHEPFMDHWAYPGVKVIRSLGQLDGGYSNDYRLDEPVGKWRLQNMINNTMNKTGKSVEKVLDVSDPVSNGNMIAVVARTAGIDEETYDAQIAALMERGILTEEIMQHMGAESDTPMAAEAVMIVANLYIFMVQ